MESYKIGFLHFNDEDYPGLLRQIFDPPYLLFYRGNPDVLKTFCIGIVGSRHASMEGLNISCDFACELAEKGYTVVSGLAIGIDSSAHNGALKKGKTIAVLACGLDKIYPSVNKKLAQRILETQGCLVSEYAPFEEALKYRFVQRNRIISGLSKALVIMQAPPKSGSLITADFALEQNRDLFFHKSSLVFDLKLGDEFIKNKSSAQAKKMMQNRVSRYVEEGAPLVSSVDELLKALFNGNIYREKTLF